MCFSIGGNVIGIAGEMIFYGILDLIAGPAFLFFVLNRYRTLDYGALGLYSAKNTGYQDLNGAGTGTVAGPRTSAAGSGLGAPAPDVATSHGASGAPGLSAVNEKPARAAV